MARPVLVLAMVAFGFGAEPDLVQAIAKVQPAVVSILTDKLERRAERARFPVVQVRSAGSGFVIDSIGHILTCNHVISGYTEIAVEFADGTRYGPNEVEVVGRDPFTDLAVLRVRPGKPLVQVELGNSDELAVGQAVAAVGNPYQLAGSATAGIVSGLSRWGQAKSSGPDFQDFVQTDALVNPGNSGGPLIDAWGRVVGVSTFVKTSSSGELTGIGFAIPINLAMEIAGQLIEHGKVIRGYLGINTQPLTGELRLALGLGTEPGILVAATSPGQPGDQAGVRPGDVILSLDSEPVPDVRWFQNQAAGRAPGDTVRLGLFRQGETTSVAVAPGAWPFAGIEPRRAPEPRAWLGLLVQDLTEADRARTGVESGVAVVAVEPAGPADEAQVRAGDVIVELGFEPVRDGAGYAALAQRLRESDRPVLVRILRGRTAFYAALVP